MTSLDQAYDEVEVITKDQARNFYYGIRLLAPSRRRALCALYALARRIDDIGDGTASTEQKLIALDQVSERLVLLKSGTTSAGPSRLAHVAGPDLVFDALADVCRSYPVPLAAIDELIAGVRCDVTGSQYETFADLATYCRCVAGSIGRLCAAVFGGRPDPEREYFADCLGIALQQVNILRDVREDLLNGRIYLPAADLAQFGVELAVNERGALNDPQGRLSELIRFSAARAHTWYAEGLRLIPLLDRRSAACASAMAGIYLRLLRDIEAKPELVFDRRLSLSGSKKVGVAVAALIGRSR